MSCGCHETYGAHLRAKNFQVTHCRSSFGRDRTQSKNNQRELDLYASARSQGIQPSGTHTAQVREALDHSDRIGRAFNAGSDSKYVVE